MARYLEGKKNVEVCLSLLSHKTYSMYSFRGCLAVAFGFWFFPFSHHQMAPYNHKLDFPSQPFSCAAADLFTQTAVDLRLDLNWDYLNVHEEPDCFAAFRLFNSLTFYGKKKKSKVLSNNCYNWWLQKVCTHSGNKIPSKILRSFCVSCRSVGCCQ